MIKFLKEKSQSWRFWTVAVAGIVLIYALATVFNHRRFIRYQGPVFLTFHELRKLSTNPYPRGLLGWKLKKFWTTPILSNEAYYQGVRTSPAIDAKLGPSLHLISWNIEKSIHMKDAIVAFSSAHGFRSLVDLQKSPEGSSAYKAVLRQRDRLEKAM